MFRRKERGKMIYRADLTVWIANTLHDQVYLFVASLWGISVLTYLLILDLTGRIKFYTIIGTIIWYFMAIPSLTFCIIALIHVPFTLDAIYEKGISSTEHTIIDFILGRTFHRYEDIRKVRICREHLDENTIWLEIKIYEKNRKKPATKYVEKIENGKPKYYKNKFLERLIDTLKKECPNAKWEYQELCIKSPQSIVKRRGVEEGNNEDGVSDGAWIFAIAYAVAMFTILLLVISIGADIIFFVCTSILLAVVLFLSWIYAMQKRTQ